MLQPFGITTAAAAATTTAAGTAKTTTAAAATVDEPVVFMDDYDIDSSCSTPYASCPSSPCRGNGPPISGFYYSAPASPMHFILSAAVSSQPISSQPEVSPSSCSPCSFEFDFSASKTSTNGSGTAGSMSSADELFLNGQIRPMKLSTHLQRPQVLSPLLDLDETADDEPGDVSRGRDVKMRDRSLRRRTRSLSPLRTTAPFGWQEDFEVNIRDVNTEENAKNGDKEDCAAATASSETTPCESGASSRSSSVGRSSSRWVFLKEFLYRSKSEGRNNGKFWGSLTFSPVKDRKIKMEKFLPSKITSGGSSKQKCTATKTTAATAAATATSAATAVLPGSSASESSQTKQSTSGPKEVKKKAVNGVGKRRVPPSPHELHYTANRAQAEELRKKTFLPYKQGLLGCLGFSSKSYGAMNGFARALNPVSSR